MRKLALQLVVALMVGCASSNDSLYMPDEEYEDLSTLGVNQCNNGGTPVCKGTGGRLKKSYSSCIC